MAARKTIIWDLALLLVILLVLSSCDENRMNTPTRTPLSTSTQSVDDSQIIVHYLRGGGIAGLTSEWIIYADGRISSSDAPEASISPESLSSLVSSIEETGYFDLEFISDPDQVCADCFVYQLLINSGELSNEIIWTDADAPLPPTLLDVLELLNSIKSDQITTAE